MGRGVCTPFYCTDTLQGVQFLFFPIFEPLPIFYFLTETSYFSYFLAGEAKICNKIENGIIVVYVLERDLS